MNCNTCGRWIQNEEANFCEYCGNSFREHSAMTVQGIAPIIQKEAVAIDKPITFWNWLASMGVLFIPWIGPFVYITMLFIWSFGNNTPINKKNWARASLIIAGVLFFLFIGMSIILLQDPSFQNYMIELYRF